MPKPPKYTKERLYAATKSIKMIYLKKAQKGLEDCLISKTNSFKLIASKLGLASDRSLWVNQDYAYLDKWYTKFRSEVDEVYKAAQENQTKKSVTKDVISSDQKANYLEIIAALEKRVEVLTIENLNLRTKLKKPN